MAQRRSNPGAASPLIVIGRLFYSSSFLFTFSGSVDRLRIPIGLLMNAATSDRDKTSQPINSPTPIERVTRLLRQAAGLAGPLAALLCVVAFFSIADAYQGGVGNFNSVGSARLVGVQSVKVAIAALGMTMIIISGGIDLSVGTGFALSGCVAAVGLRAGWGM